MEHGENMHNTRRQPIGEASRHMDHGETMHNTMRGSR